MNNTPKVPSFSFHMSYNNETGALSGSMTGPMSKHQVALAATCATAFLGQFVNEHDARKETGITARAFAVLKSILEIKHGKDLDWAQLVEAVIETTNEQGYISDAESPPHTH